MQTFGAFLVAALTATMATGAAVQRDTADEGITVHRVAHPNFVDYSGPLALMRAYNKYGVKVTPGLKAAAEASKKQLEAQGQLQARTTSGSVKANSKHGDKEYICAVNIGTPAQTLNLDFDTGSSDLWVFSDAQPASQRVGHNYYQHSKSSTATLLKGETWDISYGDGSSSSGIMYADKVQIGPLIVNPQAVEIAKTVSPSFVADTNLDGLVGLAFDSINTGTPNKAYTFFDRIEANLTKHLFTADLRHNAAGSYTFGAIPSAANALLYSPVDESNGFWEFTTSVSGLAGSFQAIADTGTSLILANANVINYYWNKMPSARYDNQVGGVVFNCTLAGKLPSFSFKVGTGAIRVPGNFMNYANIDGTRCYGGIQYQGDGNDLSIMGDVALKTSYVVFDAHNRRVGWSLKI